MGQVETIAIRLPDSQAHDFQRTAIRARRANGKVVSREKAPDEARRENPTSFSRVGLPRVPPSEA